MAWDVLSGVAKTAWDVLSGVTKTEWDVLSGVANRCGMFCPGWQKMAWDVLSRDVFQGQHFSKKKFRNTIRALNSLDKDQTRRFVGSGLAPNCL